MSPGDRVRIHGLPHDAVDIDGRTGTVTSVQSHHVVVQLDRPVTPGATKERVACRKSRLTLLPEAS